MITKVQSLSTKFNKSLTEDVFVQKSKTGLSINNRGRLVFTVGLQEYLGLEPKKRNDCYFVEVKVIEKPSSDQEKYQFYLGFHLKEERHIGANQKFFKPHISARNNYTSYIELAKYMKKAGLISRNLDLEEKGFESGPVEILDKSLSGVTPRFLIISLYQNFKS